MGICFDKEEKDDGEILQRLHNQAQKDFDEITEGEAKQVDLQDDGEEFENIQTEPQKLDNKAYLVDFKFEKVLGRGSFGKVVLVRYKRDGRLYAMKILRKDMVEKRNQKMHTKNERQILENVRHPFVVRLHYAFQNQSKLYLIMDFMIGGELFFHLRRAQKFTEERAKFYIAELILALEYLHKKGVAYRDLKPENILIGEDGHLKLTDFGLSKTNLKEGEKTNTFCGTLEYLAPEIILGQGHDQCVDWWSLGALLYEMLAGSAPFYSRDKNQMIRNRLEKNIEMKSYFSESVKSLLVQLLNKDPQQRIGYHGASEIKNHPFFNEVDWDSLLRKQIEPPFRPKVINSTDLRNFDPMFTDEPVQDTPIPAYQNKNDTYDKFTYEKLMDQSSASYHSYMKTNAISKSRDIEVNEKFGFNPK